MGEFSSEPPRCFGQGDPMMAHYHDTEWGVPVWDSRELFEHLSLDIFQSGLSWRVILAKREGFREAFGGFNPAIIANFQPEDVQKLLENESIVRNRRKIEATIGNARAFVDLEGSGRDFSEFLWAFVGGQPQKNPGYRDWSEVPNESEASAAMAHGLKRNGFTFVGPTVCYAFMQAVGMVDDHLVGCFRFGQIG